MNGNKRRLQMDELINMRSAPCGLTWKQTGSGSIALRHVAGCSEAGRA